MDESSDNEHPANGFSLSQSAKGPAFILIGILVAGLGMTSATSLQAAFSPYVYPPGTNILVTRSFEPDNFSGVSDGGVITVTVDVTNNEDVALHGFYYSDQVPSGWVVNTSAVSVNGSSIEDHTYGQGYADEVYSGSTPHRWALEIPQGGGVFSPTHPIPASGGTAQIVYAIIVSGGTGSDYATGHETWAGWLTTTPTGTAVFGYQTITSALDADFTADPLSGVEPLTVHFTDTSISDDGITTWSWDLDGDGSSDSTDENPTFEYTTSGIYTVTLTVQEADGDLDTETKVSYVTVEDTDPIADFTADVTSGDKPLRVQFTDLSTSYDGISAWNWDLDGDGFDDSTNANPIFEYTASGVYTVTLTVQEADGDLDTETRPTYITVTTPAPIADFSALPRSGVAPLTVAFTDLSTGDITAWLWDFGDGITGTTQHPTHTYAIPGYFGVTLTVSGPGGPAVESKLDYIVIGAHSAPPLADFSASPLSGTVPLTVAFTDLSAGDITTWTWSFGDGTTAWVQNPIHVYDQIGRFTVTLTTSSGTDSSTVIKPDFITVTAPPLRANFTAHPQFGLTPLNVQFTDLSVGNILTRIWDFGDGGTALLPGTVLPPGPTYTYNDL
ncbi:MAG: PKD domain-containing protein, partial [Chloroflexota bacterium]|nr:PKD domain-containing protein [Chloroflexota bacterium]